MKTVTMQAARSFVYAGRRLKAGDVFEARGTMRPGSDPAVLKAVGHAVPYTPPPHASVVPPTYGTRAMVSAPAPVATVTSDLDAMDREALLELARARGLRPHHLTGAAKLRDLIRGAA